MDIKTKGLLVSRVRMRDFDEKHIFLTEKYGYISTYSFGSRSPLSKRGKMLSKLSVYILYLENKKSNHSFFVLKDIENIHIISHIKDIQSYQNYFHFMKTIYHLYNNIEINNKEISIILDFFQSKNMGSDSSIQLEYDILYMIFLKNWGVLPSFLGCFICSNMCSDLYYYDVSKNEMIGSKCLAIRNNFLLELEMDILIFLNEFNLEYQFNISFFQAMKTKVLKMSLEEAIILFISYLRRSSF